MLQRTSEEAAPLGSGPLQSAGVSFCVCVRVLQDTYEKGLTKTTRLYEFCFKTLKMCSRIYIATCCSQYKDYDIKNGSVRNKFDWFTLVPFSPAPAIGKKG